MASSVLGQTVNTFGNSGICETIQEAVTHLPANSDAMEWPRKIHIHDVFFPEWTDIDPSQSLKLIEESYLTEQTEYIEFEMKSTDQRVKKNLLPSAKQIDIGWNKFIKPRYLNAISSKRFEFQQARLVGISGQKTAIIVFRFRAISTHKTTIQIKITPIDGLYDWQYLVRIYNQDSSYRDYPISSPPNPIQGELAVIQNSIVIFLTAEMVNSGLVEVYLPPGPIWWSGSGLPTSDACILNFR